ncbi:hemerythrin domain-containing protein [Geomonas subterranea]|uniref:Hemerythrin domain-containing protein n=1 Tax=Geomonas subterranea TaxID=2847989 RepID=A0ABX8LNP6_9BACT|nr:hemerythrin domain-containing protein [Geomonas subterranea]QXE92320.1 hemerythrin domain-containing protein [Geomonas subterranea]QXM09581.1 hemerythrin domain-containing protein [Geomonas subterranea]
MSRLIDELKKDHVAIEEMLNRVKDTSITNKEAHRLLLTAQSTLLAHLRKEDAQLYPVLNKAAQTDQGLKRTVDFYAKDMEEISGNAVAFFKKYSPDDAVIDIEFAKALGRLFATISRRLRSEENTLYSAYDKLQH